MHTITTRMSGQPERIVNSESVFYPDVWLKKETFDDGKVYACRIDGHTMPLHTPLIGSATVELLGLEDPSAYRIFEASLYFLFAESARNLLGADIPIVFENSLFGGVYITIRTARLPRHLDEKITREMKRLIDKDLPFGTRTITRDELLEYCRENHLDRPLRMIESAPDLRTAKLCTLGKTTEISYHDMVPSTGYLKNFEVRRYKNGMLLRYPRQSVPMEIPPFEEKKNLYLAFAENRKWMKTVNIKEAADLNRAVRTGEIKDLILLSEALQERRISEIASEIRKGKKRFVLIAGPSSSGKTTFAKRLSIQLRVLGLKTLYLGTDDYFLDRFETPEDENGKKDYESLRALDLPLFNTQMNDLLSGKEVDLPEFDFHEGKKVFGRRIVTLDPGQLIVVEGIHGLNPLLTEGIAEEEKYRIYISPLTQLNIDAHNRLFTNDARMLRRMVRDYQFRNYSAEMTIASWPSVKAGEEKNIFPFTDYADTFFNSHLLYELSILKKYAGMLLEKINPDSSAYPEAQRLLNFLAFFAPLEDDSLVPNNSIVREFIGGSVFL